MNICLRRAGSLLLALLCLTPSATGAAVSLGVSQTDIDAENVRWRDLGVKLPVGGVVLAHPFDTPYSNRSFVVPESWYKSFYVELRAKHDVSVDAAQLRADLPMLRFLLENTYAGYHTAAAHGWNWDRMFADWNRQLARDGTKALTLEEAFSPWGRLEDVQLDNHSGVPGLTTYTSGSSSAVLSTNAGAACTSLRTSDGRSFPLSTNDRGQQPHTVQSWDGTRLSPATYISYPKRLGNASSLQCGGRDVAVTVIKEVQAPSQLPVYHSLGEGISYLRLPTFTDVNNEALGKVLAAVPNLGKERLVIFDLRGNDGGNAPIDMLSNWFTEAAIKNAAKQSTQFGTKSCFRTALAFGLQQQLSAGVKAPISPSLLEQLQNTVDTLSGSATPNCKVEATVARSNHSLRQHTFQAQPEVAAQTRIVALVDNGCGSDCEYMTYMLANLPNSVIVGTSTYGVLGFTEPGYFMLPHSRVPFRLALSRTDEYGDGRSVDGYGITVDVLLSTVQSQTQQSLSDLARALAR